MGRLDEMMYYQEEVERAETEAMRDCYDLDYEKWLEDQYRQVAILKGLGDIMRTVEEL